MNGTRERWLLGATLVVATAVPLAARAAVHAKTARVAAHLSAAGGVPVRIGGIDADLTGAIRLRDVAFGSLVAVDAIEAAVSMGSLVDGELRADEIRVTAPRVAMAIDAGGDSDLAQLARRLARHRSARPHGGSRLRRIVVDGGALTVHVAGAGDLTAEDLELVPDGGGVRIIAGRIRVHATTARAGVDLEFARGAAELALPAMTMGRALAVNGTGTLHVGDATAHLVDLGAGRLVPGRGLELRGAVDDEGVPRRISVTLGDARGIAFEGDRVPLRVAAGLAPHGIDLSHARASGDFWMRPAPGGALALAGMGTLTGLAITHPTVATTPVVVDAWINADVTIDRDAVVVRDAHASVGAITVGLSGWVRRTGIPAAQLDVTLDPGSCPALFAAIPAAIRGPLDGLGLDGGVGATARIAVDLAAPDGEGVKVTGDILGGCRVTTEPPGADVAALAAPGDQQLADGSVRRMDPAEDWYSSLDNLPDHVTGAFVSAEDGRFWHHDGFDLEQIARSFEIDLREHRLARGGSTISQQLVKNAFLSQRRTLDRKLQEAVLTWRLEARLGKRAILERYLNIIELGPHLFGVHDAARYYFDRRPSDLTVRQAAFLAALTSQPASMSRRVRRAGGVDPDTADRIGAVLRAMRRDGVIDPETYSAAKDAPLDFAPAAIAD